MRLGLGPRVRLSPNSGIAALQILSVPGSFTIGTPRSGTILNAYPGSTIVLASGPAGFSINSAARTWSYDGTGTATSGTLTLTETLNGVSGSPKTTSIAWVVSAGAVLDSSLSTPFLSTVSVNADGTSPVIDVALQPDYAVNDTLRVYRRNKAGTLIQTYTHVITAAEAGASAADLSLAGVPAGTWRYTADVLKATGLTYGPLSNVLIQGPDDIEPVLSAPITPTGVAAAQMTVGCTTDTGEGTMYVVLTTANSAPTALQVENGQNASGTATPGANIPVSSIGAKTLTVTGLTASTTYYIWYMHKDVAGNRSLVLNGGSQATLAPGSSAKLVIGSGSTGAGATRSQYIDSTDGYTATVNVSTGAANLITSTFAPPAKAHYEATLTTINSGSSVYAGFVDSAAAVGAAVFTIPGNSGGQAGITVEAPLGNSSVTVYANGSAVTLGVGTTVASGHIIILEADTAANSVVIKYKYGATTVTVGTYSLTSQVPTNYRAHVGGKNATDSVTANFGATTFAVTPTTGYAGW